jgi:hypothetical protein
MRASTMARARRIAAIAGVCLLGALALGVAVQSLLGPSLAVSSGPGLEGLKIQGMPLMRPSVGTVLVMGVRKGPFLIQCKFDGRWYRRVINVVDNEN